MLFFKVGASSQHTFMEQVLKLGALQTAPIYISEIAPPKWRGALNIMFQLSTTAGILVASGINYGALVLPMRPPLCLPVMCIPHRMEDPHF